VHVELGDGRVMKFEFFDPTRLRQDIERSFQDGQRFYFEPTMIVVPEVTREMILDAIRALSEKGYF